MMATPTSSTTTNLQMLALHEKKSGSLDLYRPLRTYVSFYYSDREAQDLEDDFDTVNHLRSSICSVADSPPSKRDALIRYYKSLSLIESRFPISPDIDALSSLKFTWFDAFKPKTKASEVNISLEKAGVLFNLAAVYSQIGLGFDRGTVEGRKAAVNAFGLAAGVFGFLRDGLASKVAGFGTVDVSADCVGMLERLMLAQGQECCFDSTIARGSTPGVCAKIARQVGIYYEEALAALTVAPLNQHFDKTWIAHVQLKASLFYAEACYRYSLELHEKEEIAQEIARLKSGINALSEVKKSAKGAPAQLLDAVSKLEASLNLNLERAMKENDRVYLQRVPPASSIPPLPAFSMVKPLPVDEILDASKEKMFLSLVPDSSTKALSKYTEMVDDVIRTQAEKLQQGSELARVRLKEMDLPDSLLSLDGNSSLPDNLKDDVEAVQISGGPGGLEAELQQLRDLKRVNHELLVQTEELLQKEAQEDAQFRTQFGTRWTRPQSSTLTKNLQDRLNRFAGNLKQAGESDARIEHSVKDYSSLMSILDRHPIEAVLPTLAKPIMSLDANEDAVVGALKLSLRHLETLGAERASLEDMLKEMKRKDDILPKLMTFTGSYEDLFKKEISKYDQICEEIGQNLAAQEQLLIQIQAQNRQFAALFNLEDYKASQERCFKQIEAAVAKYREIKENINEGLKFYVTLQDAITNVKQQCDDFAMTRNIQCREMIEEVQGKVAGLSLADRNTSVGAGQAQQPPRTISPHQTDTGYAAQASGPRPPYYQPSQSSTRPGYGAPPYGSSHHQSPPPPHYGSSHHQPPPNHQLPQQYQQPPAASQQPPPNHQLPQQYQQPPAASQQPPPPPYGSSHQQPPPQYQQPPAASQQPPPHPYGSSHYQPPQQHQQPPPPTYGSPHYQPPPHHQQPPQQHQQPPAGHEYGQPAYPGWQGSYYNAHSQQPGSSTRPPYNVPGSYPPHQSGYYRPQ